MVAVEQPAPRIQAVDRAVCEVVGASAEIERLQHGAVGDQSQREDRPKPCHRRDLSREELTAGRDLRPLRLVLRRDAANRIGDSTIVQREAIGGVSTVGTVGEAEIPEGGVKQVAGKIACERPACAIGPAQSGRETDDQQSRVKSTQARHRCIVPVRLGSPMTFTKGGESWA